MNPEDNQTSPTTMDTSINSVSVKLPICWRDNIALWFAQAESQFTNSRVKDDFTKYNIIVAALDADTLRCVSDVVIKPPAADKYNFLKTCLIERLQDSEEKRLARLLTGLQLDDRKPTGLLRHMVELAGPALAESAIIRTLWLQRLPQNVQAILSAIPENNLFQLASAADKILEVYDKTECGAVDREHQRSNNHNQTANSRPEPDLSSTLRRLQEQIMALTEEVHQLKTSRHGNDSGTQNFFNRNDNYRRRAGRHPSPAYSNSARRNRSKSRGKPADLPNDAGKICYYHSRYGAKAYKCTKPCDFKNDMENFNGSPL